MCRSIITLMRRCSWVEKSLSRLALTIDEYEARSVMKCGRISASEKRLR